MAFVFPAYHAPDFSAPQLKNAPDAAWAPVERDRSRWWKTATCAAATA